MQLQAAEVEGAGAAGEEEGGNATRQRGSAGPGDMHVCGHHAGWEQSQPSPPQRQHFQHFFEDGTECPQKSLSSPKTAEQVLCYTLNFYVTGTG